MSAAAAVTAAVVPDPTAAQLAGMGSQLLTQILDQMWTSQQEGGRS